MNGTTFGISNEFLHSCLNRFEDDKQLDMLQEECAELIQACSKLKRGTSNSRDKLKEEMAHVLISSAMVARIFEISEEDIALEVQKKADKYSFEAYNGVVLYVIKAVLALPNKNGNTINESEAKNE